MDDRYKEPDYGYNEVYWGDPVESEPKKPDTDNNAFTFGLLGLFLTCGCGMVGLVFAILALVKSSEYRKANEEAGNIWPTNKASNAKVLAILAIVIYVLRIVATIAYYIIIVTMGVVGGSFTDTETIRATVGPGIEMITSIMNFMV